MAHKTVKYRTGVLRKLNYSFMKDTRFINCTVIRFVSTNAKFGICTVVGLNGTLVEDKMRKF